MPKKTTKKHGFDVVTIGGATRDVFVRSKKFQTIRDPAAPDGFDACFPLGAKIDVDDILFETGGGATNAAVTFSRLGLRTACIGRIGKDVGGRELVENLRGHGIDTAAFQLDPKLGTAYSIILLSGSGHRSILVHRGASARIDPAKLTLKALAPAWVYLTSVGGNLPLLKRIFSTTKTLSIHVAWNPGNAELALGFKRLLPFLTQTDILDLNREEAAELADTPPRHLDAILHLLGTVPRQALVVTDGQDGAYVHSRGVTWHAPALPGRRVNATGAGDAFGSGFVAAAIRTGNLEKALRVGMLNATGVVTHMGAKAGILKRFPTAADMRRVKVKPY
ncbi:carbohydrate kinase family protein [Patescibacteria group bacterium]|nr:carbohydrate kinase family protein [Patescibacteria group bacterium]MBU1448862.1 carbohydrate kinase family protein [Patescibacteria group bacterium]MBU2613650.1 carbohydrate kinase family protein [Patescibacteria group bacterium]